MSSKFSGFESLSENQIINESYGKSIESMKSINKKTLETYKSLNIKFSKSELKESYHKKIFNKINSEKLSSAYKNLIIELDDLDSIFQDSKQFFEWSEEPELIEKIQNDVRKLFYNLTSIMTSIRISLNENEFDEELIELYQESNEFMEEEIKPFLNNLKSQITSYDISENYKLIHKIIDNQRKIIDIKFNNKDDYFSIEKTLEFIFDIVDNIERNLNKLDKKTKRDFELILNEKTESNWKEQRMTGNFYNSNSERIA